MPELPEGKVTQGIAIATAAAFFLLWIAGWLDVASLKGGFIPARVSGLVQVPGAVPVWLTPLSATLVHAGLLHIGFNLLMFVFVGRFVESVIGGGASLILYIVGAYAAALLHWSMDPTSTVPMVGASGAISATFGAYALFFGRDRTRGIGPLSGYAVRVLWLASAWIFVQALIGMAALGGVQVAIFAHIGGFVAGLALARPLLLWRYRKA
ncbi:rhomboid family intramembrane serine protease [Sphingomonas sp. MAH-20]|uniref:Rhomboid family intramembrane serine protease n=1 Tax=Sphingomonas horti TaxID=2682842 RepID=A0A6I4IWF9_9SPHN|nr:MULTISPECIES: rhomboid family intramembrane serine protease [Sphingomonas]MBA2920098.1 rhomboid family intramembrane serine protease [Sphingomonas sp. CGMCC 1.13658]MVO76353.1 rhomboid family intramembrane serine protease [Sphingomonas horti]